MMARFQAVLLGVGLGLVALGVDQGRAADAPAPPASNGRAVQVLASDASGVTFRFTLPPYRIQPVDRPEGGFYRVDAAGLGSSLAEEGRPALPAEAALVALPAGTVPHLSLSEESFETVAGTDGREPEPVGRSEFEADGRDFSPTRVFARDADLYDRGGPWPAASAELGTEGRWRYQRVLPVRIQPFRYEPATRSLRALTSATIRVDFLPASRKGAATLDRPDAYPVGAQPGPRVDAGSEGLYRGAILNYEAAREFRIAPAPATRVVSATLGSGAPEWTIRVDTTGVWRVTYAQLAAKTFPAGIASGALSLGRREYAQDTNPPFVTVDVPMRVIEGASGTPGVFDAADAIEFYGQTWRERARPTWYRGRFGDGEVYFLSVASAGTPPRIPEISADRGFITPPRPASFPSFRRYENRFFYSAFPRDTCQTYLTWTQPFEDQHWTDTLTTFTPDVDATGSVRFRATFIGVAPFPSLHTIWMRWKRPSDNLITPVMTRAWNGQLEVVSDTTFAANLIASGTNKIDWRGYSYLSSDAPDAYSGATLRNYEVTYSRLYRAFRNVLDLNSSDASGSFEIEVDGFTAVTKPQVTVYDVTDSTSPRALMVPDTFVNPSAPGVWAARFQDTVVPATQNRYFAVLSAPPLPDAAIALASADRLWEGPGQPDYLIVTPDEFLAPALQLAALRRSQGHDVQVATLSAVAQAFDGGRRTDWAIRRYFEFAFANWGTRLAVLLGDGSEDPRGETAESNRDWVPVHTINGPVGISAGNELSASDFWYVNDLTRTSPYFVDCFTFEPDLFADMSLGRLPAGSLAEAQGLVNKLIAFDTQDREGAWRSRILLVSDDEYSTSSFSGVASQYCYKDQELVFETISDTLETVIRQDGGFRDLGVEQFRLREKLLPLNRPVPGCQGLGRPGYGTARDYVASYTRPQFLTELGKGALVVNFQGHGSEIVLAHEFLLQGQNARDVELLSNDGKPFFFLSYSCHVNKFSSARERAFGYESLGEQLVIGPTGAPAARPLAGAIGSYASTNYELLPSDPSGHNHINVWQFRSLFVNPPSDSYLGERGARVLLGEAMNLGSALTVANVGGLERRAVQTYLLLGDPGTALNTGAPRIYATANGQDVATGVRYQPGAPGDSIVFDTDLVDESRIDELTLTLTGEGARAVTPGEAIFTPTYPDTANGGGGRRYHLVWTVTPEAKDVDLSIALRDRFGLATSFTLPLRLEAVLYANGQRVNNGGTAPTTGTYQFVVTSPAQLLAQDLALTVDGAPVAGVVIAPAATDSSRRVWSLTWQGDLAEGPHAAAIGFPGGATRSVTFSTSDVARVAIQRVFAFPTPFADPPVTFNFTLDSDQLVDVLVKVYSVAGHLVWQRKESALGPGYHQLVWDGLDTQGDGLSNGTYLYRILATDTRGLKAVGEGKLVRLR